MTYNVFDLCENKGDYFEVDPAVIFPATIARIQEVLKGEPPNEIVSKGWTGRADREPVADKFVRQAESLPAAAWALALEPYTEPPKDGPTVEQQVRASALGLAESWFKRALALAVGHGVRIHFSRRPEYRR